MRVLIYTTENKYFKKILSLSEIELGHVESKGLVYRTPDRKYSSLIPGVTEFFKYLFSVVFISARIAIARS